MNVCWAPTVDAARQIVCEWWPNGGLAGGYTQELSIPAYFEDVARLVTPEQAARAVAYGPDPGVHLAALRAVADAGYDTVYVHQVGPDQAGFFQFYAEQILPRLQG